MYTLYLKDSLFISFLKPSCFIANQTDVGNRILLRIKEIAYYLLLLLKNIQTKSKILSKIFLHLQPTEIRRK
jgi:hypothetical protein